MADVEIYTKEWCGFCSKAKRVLGEKNVAFREVPIDGDASKRQEMINRAGGRTTVPQIFIDGDHIGGCDDLLELDRSGKLDARLSP